MNLTPQRIRTLIEQHLGVLYPSSSGEVEITFLAKDDVLNIWKVNVRFKRDSYDHTGTTGLLSINTNGEITQFKEGWGWRS